MRSYKKLFNVLNVYPVGQHGPELPTALCSLDFVFALSVSVVVCNTVTRAPANSNIRVMHQDDLVKRETYHVWMSLSTAELKFSSLRRQRISWSGAISVGITK